MTCINICMQYNYQPNTDYFEEKLWNEHYLYPATELWNTSVVLCCYTRTDFDPVKKLARIFANKVDKQFGSVKKGKTYDISQRIEKLQMLEFGEKRRGWHINVFLNCPKNIDQLEFFDCMHDIWLNTILEPWQIERIGRDSDLFWAGQTAGGFHKYGIKKRAEQASIPRPDQIIGLTKSANDLLVQETLTIHESNPNS